MPVQFHDRLTQALASATSTEQPSPSHLDTSGPNNLARNPSDGLLGGDLTHGQGHSHDGQWTPEHGHTHEHLEHPGKFSERDLPMYEGRDWEERGYTVGIGGPVGSGKTALLLALCVRLREEYNIAVVTNDIFTTEDATFLMRHNALPSDRIRAIETGGCPPAAIREDISANLSALEALQHEFQTELLLIESGGDNLAANFSRELADFIIYVIDVAGGDKVPRKGGPGISQSDLLVINKTDLAPHVGASLDVMKRDADLMRDAGPTVFASVRNDEGVDDILQLILSAFKISGADRRSKGKGKAI